MILRVGTRGSKLSLIQTEIVIKKLKEKFPELEVKTEVIKTLGDIIDKPLLEISRKGIFEKEIDQAVLRGDVDFAVHSLKDVPTEYPPEIDIVSIPERNSPYDVLVTRERLTLETLPPGSVVGTSSPRRYAQVLSIRRDLEIKPIRGNVDTRIRKLKEGLYDALILAETGLKRLGLSSLHTQRLPVNTFTPAPGQGALAVVARLDNKQLLKYLLEINDELSMAEIKAERAFIREIGGGCKIPVGALARAENNTLTLYASILSPNGKKKIFCSLRGPTSKPEDIGVELAIKLKEKGADKIIQKWRAYYGQSG